MVEIQSTAARAYVVIETTPGGPVFVADFEAFPDVALLGEIGTTYEVDASLFVDGAFRRPVVWGRETVKVAIEGTGHVIRFADQAAYEARPDADLRAAIRKHHANAQRLRGLLAGAMDALNLWPRKCRLHPLHVGPGCKRCRRIALANVARERWSFYVTEEQR